MEELFVEKYKIAEKHYANAIELITELVTRFKEEKCPDYDVNYALAQYDVMLQAVLLASVAQGEVEMPEIGFIENLTKHGDLMNALNAEISEAGLDYEEIEWGDIGSMMSRSQAVSNRIVKLVSQIAYNVSEGLIDDIAFVDACDKRCDFLDKLLNETLPIVIAICESDGDSMQDFNPSDDEVTGIENEISVGTDLLRKMLSDRWKKRLDALGNGAPDPDDN